MDRRPGWSVRLKLALSYAAFLLLAGILLLGAAWWYLLRGFPPSVLLPDFSKFFDNLDPHNFGPRVFGSAAVLVLGFLLVFGLAGGWLLAGRVLAPLDAIAQVTRRTDGGSLAHRIRLPGRRDEFRELADALDSMLDRLQAHVDEQQRFAANASHELRTPQAIMQTLLDVAGNDPALVTDELVARLHAVNARAIDLTEALLLLSRAQRESFAPEDVDLSLLAEGATETLLPLAEKNGVQLELSGIVSPMRGSSALLLQMTTNLLHNAVVHNLPGGGAVWIATAQTQDMAVLTVENTGEVLDADLVTTLREPFQRATQRIHTDQAGVGLGLAIVSRIVEAHGGRLTLAPRSGGGLRVEVQLPRSHPVRVGHSSTRISGALGRAR